MICKKFRRQWPPRTSIDKQGHLNTNFIFCDCTIRLFFVGQTTTSHVRYARINYSYKLGCLEFICRIGTKQSILPKQYILPNFTWFEVLSTTQVTLTLTLTLTVLSLLRGLQLITKNIVSVDFYVWNNKQRFLPELIFKDLSME